MQPGRRMIHLINFAVGKQLNTGWRHPGRNLLPVADIKVRIQLRSGQKIREVRLATDETVVSHRVEGNWVEINVPKLIDHEIVIFEFA
jgi:hypothetical protein